MALLSIDIVAKILLLGGQIIAELVLAAEVAIAIQGIVDSRRKRDWPTMDDVIKDMQNDIDDYLFEMERSHWLKLATEFHRFLL